MVSLSYNSTTYTNLPQENGSWEIIHSYIDEQNNTISGKLYSSLKLHHKLKRKNSYYLMTVIIPFILTSLIGVFVFIIPSERSEKTSFGLTVLLSECVLLVMISDIIPSTSSETPILGKCIKIEIYF